MRGDLRVNPWKIDMPGPASAKVARGIVTCWDQRLHHPRQNKYDEVI